MTARDDVPAASVPADGVRTVLITGAAGGPGRALAVGFAAQGDRVVAADHDVAGARATVALIEAGGGTALAVGVDVTVLNSARALALTAADFSSEHGGEGRIDVVINAATHPVTGGSAFTAVDVEEWDRVMSVNFKGSWLVTRACSRFLPEGGKVVNLARWGGTAPAVHSAASEGGVIALTRVLAAELGERGITVNAIAAGGGAEPGDVVGAALFLAGPGSDRITGQALAVHLGRRLG